VETRECIICGAKITAPRVKCKDCEADEYVTYSCPPGYDPEYDEINDEVLDWYIR